MRCTASAIDWSPPAPVRLAVIVALGALFCVELLWAYPATAADLTGRVAHGRMLAEHHANPFIFGHRVSSRATRSFPTSPTQGSRPSTGPVWVILLGAGVALLAHGDLLVEVLVYKGVAALAHLAGGGLVYAIARRLTGDVRAKARASAYLYLWNPMLLWEMVAWQP